MTTRVLPRGRPGAEAAVEKAEAAVLVPGRARVFARAVVAVLIRHRRLVAAILAAVAGLLTLTVPPDLAAFSAAGDLLLHGHLSEVYAGAWNQAGPAQLLISRLLTIGGEPSPITVAIVDAFLVAGAMWLCARLASPDAAGGAGAVRREAVAGVLALVWVAAPLPWNGHPAELAIPALWALAIVLARRNRHLPAAGALALGVAIAPWAILGIPGLLAAAPQLRTARTGALAAFPVRAVWTGLLATILGAGFYLPFALSGHFALFDQSWDVAPGTIPALLGLHDASWWLRPVQAVLTGTGVALVAWRLRSDRLAVAVVPLVAGLLRVMTDPVAHPYYWFPVAVASVALVAMSAGSRPWAAAVALTAVVGSAAGLTIAGPVVCLALLGIVCRRPARLSSRSATVLRAVISGFLPSGALAGCREPNGREERDRDLAA